MSSSDSREDYEVLAIRYGHWQTHRADLFYRYSSYGEPDAEVRMDFFYWLVRNDKHAYLIDTGFSAGAISTRPGRNLSRPARDAVAALGTDPDLITDIVISHLHYDHTGYFSAFPGVHMYVQKIELDFWRSPYAQHPPQIYSQQQDELDYVYGQVDKGNVTVLEGTAEVLPGITLQLVGGHTPGQCMIRIDNAKPILLCSDAAHYYEEFDKDRPFDIGTDLIEMYDAYAEIRRQAEAGTVVVPGHDPLVLERFPTVYTGDDGLVAVRVSA